MIIRKECGINNIRNTENVEDSFNHLISKVERICQLCPSARINVSPILPTRLHHLNKKALLFNSLLFNYVNSCNPRVGNLDFTVFLDNEFMLLDRRFCRYQNQSDPIHLGSTGIFTLARIIRDKVNSPIDGRSFRDVLSHKFVTKPRVLPQQFT